MNSNANRVAFNTFVQYIQLALSVLIGLYSVRLILNALGEVDYGIYDVIGGIVALLAFISSSLSQSSMRFISIRLGEGDEKKMRETVGSCFWLHLLIAAGLSLLIEFVGLFLFDGYLNIPEERIRAAKFVYHTVTLTLFLNVIESPYRALIAAHEEFWYSSLVAFLNSVLKLGIAFAITYWFADKLVAYGSLLLGVTLLDVLLVVGFSFLRHKHEMSLQFNGSEIKSITSFVGWTMLDVLGSTLNRQGYAIMLNRFFGPVMNTTFALSRQIEGHLYTVSSSAVNTVKPQIMKSYGYGDEDRMFRLSLTAGKFGFALISILSIPIIIMMPDILTIWLKHYPEETVLFSRLMIIACMIEQLTRGLVFANQAVGNIKWFSIIVSSLRIAALPISWIFLKLGFPAYIAIFIFLICEGLGSFARAIILSKISNFKITDFVKSVLKMILPPVLVAFVFCWIIYQFVPHSIWMMILVFLITAGLYAVLIYFTGLTKDEKSSVIGVAKSFLSKFI